MRYGCRIEFRAKGLVMCKLSWTERAALCCLWSSSSSSWFLRPWHCPVPLHLDPSSVPTFPGSCPHPLPPPLPPWHCLTACSYSLWPNTGLTTGLALQIWVKYTEEKSLYKNKQNYKCTYKYRTRVIIEFSLDFIYFCILLKKKLVWDLLWNNSHFKNTILLKKQNSK